MCNYCMIGDWAFRHNPPWPPPYQSPLIPQPLPSAPLIPWDFQKLAEFHDLLRRVKELEDKLGCPCEPNKADYLGLIKERLATLEKLVADNARKASP